MIESEEKREDGSVAVGESEVGGLTLHYQLGCIAEYIIVYVCELHCKVSVLPFTVQKQAQPNEQGDQKKNVDGHVSNRRAPHVSGWSHKMPICACVI